MLADAGLLEVNESAIEVEREASLIRIVLLEKVGFVDSAQLLLRNPAFSVHACHAE